MKLKSEFGNIVKITSDPVKAERLKEQGYTEVTSEKDAKPFTARKIKAESEKNN